jgi:methionine synthase I (cobalamin-dependent)
MGTVIQTLGLGEDDFRADRFEHHSHDLAGNNDLLVLTQPDAMRAIHLDYFLAGADIVETNTFSSTRIAQGDYGTTDVIHDMNVAAARVAREAAEEAHGRDGRQRFVAGAVGPTNMTLSISPRVEDPGYRSITFAGLAAAYEEQIDALIEGGVDLLLIETIFDTLNAKAVIVAARRALARAGTQLPLMISGTITDRSGRTLSGQTPAAFWQSIRHAQPLSIVSQVVYAWIGSSALRTQLPTTARSQNSEGLYDTNGSASDCPSNCDRNPEQSIYKSALAIVPSSSRSPPHPAHPSIPRSPHGPPAPLQAAWPPARCIPQMSHYPDDKRPVYQTSAAHYHPSETSCYGS